HQGERVLRYIRGDYSPVVGQLLEAAWFSELVQSGRIIASTRPDPASFAARGAFPADTGLVLEHPRVEFLSYAYEWPFEMLQEAALLQLELCQRAFANGYGVKDATPFNIQFVGGKPLFIDVTSFEPYEEGSG